MSTVDGYVIANEAPEYELQYFTDLPAGTGLNSLVIIQDALDLEVGDEVGLFDTNAILNSGDCSSETGELLVGAGVWSGQQLEIVGVGSVDNCAFGGFNCLDIKMETVLFTRFGKLLRMRCIQRRQRMQQVLEHGVSF